MHRLMFASYYFVERAALVWRQRPELRPFGSRESVTLSQLVGNRAA
jgi:hypothetical protein